MSWTYHLPLLLSSLPELSLRTVKALRKFWVIWSNKKFGKQNIRSKSTFIAKETRKKILFHLIVLFFSFIVVEQKRNFEASVERWYWVLWPSKPSKNYHFFTPFLDHSKFFFQILLSIFVPNIQLFLKLFKLEENYLGAVKEGLSRRWEWTYESIFCSHN